MSLLPAIVTLLFIILFLVPTIGNLNEIKGQLKDEKASFQETQNNLASIKSNKRLEKDVEKLREELADFDVQIPEKDELAVFVVDISKFANNSNVKLLRVSSGSPDDVAIQNPKAAIKKENKKARTSKKKKKAGDNLPVSLSNIPVEISVEGNYPYILGFINTLELYQRKVMIESISINKAEKSKKAEGSQVLLSLKGGVYKLTKREVIPEEVSDKKDKKSEKSQKEDKS